MNPSWLLLAFFGSYSSYLIGFLCVDIGSTDEYWKRQDAAQVIALVEYNYSHYFQSFEHEPLICSCFRFFE